MQLSVMLWTLQGSFDQRLEAAAQAGIGSLQLVGEWSQWGDAEFDRVNALRRSLGLGVDALVAQQNWRQRPVSLVDPSHREGFLADLATGLAAAQKLECARIILMAGDEVAGVPRVQQHACLVEGLRRGGELAAREKITLILEPLNSRVDHPGYFLTTAAEGLQAVEEADNPSVKLLFDIYHEQVQSGNVIDTLSKNLPQIAVFHVAGCPGRHEPGAGELNYPNIYRAIAQGGFQGHIAMEYLPRGEQVASLTQAVGDFRKATSAGFASNCTG